MREMTSAIVRCLPLAALLALSGCGVELTGGGERGETEVVMTDSPGPDGGSTSYAPSRSVAPDDANDGSAGVSRDLAPTSKAAIVTGTLDVTASAALLTPDGLPVRLTAGNTSVELGLAASDSVRLALRTLSEATFPVVRLTFTAIEATLQAPILTNSGTSLEGTISVDLSDGPLTIDVPQTVVIRDEERAVIVVDLNAALWLAFADPITRSVASDIFRAVVAVEVE